MEDTIACLPNDGKAHRAVLGGEWRLFGLFDGEFPAAFNLAFLCASLMVISGLLQSCFFLFIHVYSSCLCMVTFF